MKAASSVNGDRPSHTIYLETETAAIPRPNSLLGFRREAAKPSPFTVGFASREYMGSENPRLGSPQTDVCGLQGLTFIVFCWLRELCPQTPLPASSSSPAGENA
jgi:hypothetical protein